MLHIYIDCVMQMLEVPSLLEEGSRATKRHVLTQTKQFGDDHSQYKSGCCS